MKIFELPEINTIFTCTSIMRGNETLRADNKQALHKIIEYLKNKENPYTLFVWQYTTLDNRRWQKIKPGLERILKELNNVKIVICCNDIDSLKNVPTEYNGRLTCILCNHNATVSRKIFDIKNCDKIWDSVYTARFDKFKRHELSYNLKNILYLTSGYKWKIGYSLKGHLLLIKNQANPFTLYSQHISSSQLKNVLNQSKVGLCLSSAEGAMYSSVEYLLCGLPIVSTKSTGGRDVFFTNENCIIAEDTPESVAECVQKWLSNYPNLHQRREIRQKAISIQKQHTRTLKNKLKEISNNVDIDRLYKEKYLNKMNNNTDL